MALVWYSDPREGCPLAFLLAVAEPWGVSLRRAYHLKYKKIKVGGISSVVAWLLDFRHHQKTHFLGILHLLPRNSTFCFE